MSELYIGVSIEERINDIVVVSTAVVTMEENRGIMTEEEKKYPRLQPYIEEMMDGLHAREDRVLIESCETPINIILPTDIPND